MKYDWFGDGYLLAGFANGFVVAVSSHLKEIGEELQCIRVSFQPQTLKNNFNFSYFLGWRFKSTIASCL